MDASYLENKKNALQFRHYTVMYDYFAVDSRHLSLKVGETLSAFS